MPSINSEGLILKAQSHSEADRIYTIYTKKAGKIRVVAKGVRKISSRRSGNLDSLNLVSFAYSKYGTFPILTEVSVLNSFTVLKKDLEKVRYGYEILELVDKFLVEEDEHIEIYNLLVETLQNLNRLKDGGRKLALLNFKAKLLGFLGYDPVLNFCVSCYRDFDGTWDYASFSNSMGGIGCDQCAKKGEGAIGFGSLSILVVLRNLNFKKVQELEIEKDDLAEAGEVLTGYCEYLLSSPIRSSKIFSK